MSHSHLYITHSLLVYILSTPFMYVIVIILPGVDTCASLTFIYHALIASIYIVKGIWVCDSNTQARASYMYLTHIYISCIHCFYSSSIDVSWSKQCHNTFPAVSLTFDIKHLLSLDFSMFCLYQVETNKYTFQLLCSFTDLYIKWLVYHAFIYTCCLIPWFYILPV